jgi:hypothetical protein
MGSTFTPKVGFQYRHKDGYRVELTKYLGLTLYCWRLVSEYGILSKTEYTGPIQKLEPLSQR